MNEQESIAFFLGIEAKRADEIMDDIINQIAKFDDEREVLKYIRKNYYQDFNEYTYAIIVLERNSMLIRALNEFDIFMKSALILMKLLDEKQGVKT